MQMTVGDIGQATCAIKIKGNKGALVHRVCTDTRKLMAGDLYVALKGPHFDGHNFIGEACQKGAVGALVSHAYAPPKELGNPFVLVSVEDTLKALGNLAHTWRLRYQVPVIAITGSVGKTTTKDMLSACLSLKGPVCKTEGNLNNLIGLPLTLLNLDAPHRYAVIEMGMNAFGEIARLAEIASPTIGLITNVGRAHLEGVGSIEGVARAKGELFLALGPADQALVNLDDPYVAALPTQAQKITFGFNAQAMICGRLVAQNEKGMTLAVVTPHDQAEVFLPFLGEPKARNFLSVVAVGYALNISLTDIILGVEQFAPGKMRGEQIHYSHGSVLINDAYNANPESMIAALKTMKPQFSNKRCVVFLGDMFELGSAASTLHEAVGEAAGLESIDVLVAVGDYAADYERGYKRQGGKQCVIFKTMEALQGEIESLVKPGDAFLVKGSRGAQMERLIEWLPKQKL